MIRWLTAAMLAVGAPLLALWLLCSEFFDPIWMTLPDTVIAVILTFGIPLSPRSRFSMLFVLSLGMGFVFIMNPRMTALFMPVLMNLALSLTFLLTLKPPEVPLITRLAQRVRNQRPLPLELQAYTQRLTECWGVLLILLALNGLYWALSSEVTLAMLFANTLNFFIMASFFVCELFYRRIRFRHLTPSSPIQVLRVMRRDGLNVTKHD